MCYIRALIQQCLELGKQLMRSDDVSHLKSVIKNEDNGKKLAHIQHNRCENEIVHK